MALELRQNLNQQLRLTQELVMTPQLQQAIKLLQLSRLELLERVREEIEENPLLEEVREDGASEETAQPEAETPVADPAHVGEDPEPEEAAPSEPEIDWEQFIAHYDVNPTPDAPIDFPEERPSYENYLTPETTLQDHLLWQLRLSPIERDDRTVAELIIGNVDEDGYLRATVEEIAQVADTTPEHVERVLGAVQEFDPLGVASRSLEECLLRQVRELDLDPLVERVIQEGMKELENKNYKRLAARLGVEFEDVVDAARQISQLEPRPGRNFASTGVDYVVPDVYVVKEGDEYVVRLNDEGVPRLRISRYYQRLLKDDRPESQEARGYIQERMQAAVWLIKSIHQRQQTLYKVASSIVKFQREFLDKGVNYLRPLILRDVADDIGMHESTVSRITTHKYMHTPQGTFELKFFFSSGIQSSDGEDLASRSVKARIRELISKEDPQKPLSDLEIARQLAQRWGLKIARRTVSKYRESMGILPSSSRKRYF
ncbi:MAG: RNA polymerase factor sigma-54 [Deltaproteobacteria bacterium]|nr:RNA polymerase factor sigma-54 [Deltaproteobacteria bacterium]